MTKLSLAREVAAIPIVKTTIIVLICVFGMMGWFCFHLMQKFDWLLLIATVILLMVAAVYVKSIKDVWDRRAHGPVLLYVNVRQARSSTDDEDSGVSGIYKVWVNATYSVPLITCASIALDIFHDQVAIGDLDAFEITVLNEQFEPVGDDPDHQENCAWMGSAYKSATWALRLSPPTT